MDSSFGVLDAFAFVVFAVLIFVGVIIVVSLGKLPGQLARKWDHPQASAINAMSWIGIATGGLLWPIAFIWAFTNQFGAKPAIIKDDRQPRGAVETDAIAMREAASRKISGDKESRS
jgi:ABC-type Mn2+/Zn2+ transport system permease subunit